MRPFFLLSLAFSLLSILSISPQAAAQSTDRARLQTEIESSREQLKSREKEFLSPAPADRAAFAEFLAAPGTGIIRILPRPRTESESKVSVRGGGAFYSFARLTHEYGWGSDIGLEQGQFSVGFAGADYGFLAALGDVPLESIALDTPCVAFLVSLEPPSELTEARAQYAKSAGGVEQGGVTYKNRVAATAGQTYILRSVNYGESDVMVGFRVVRKDDDDSLILLWKMLRKSPVPNLVKEKE